MKARTYKVVTFFCGSGLKTLGILRARGKQGSRFESIGAFDVDPIAVADFELLTGAHAKVLTTEQLAERCDGRPDMVVMSPPCRGYSGCLPEGVSQSEKYQLLNRLALRSIDLAVETWETPPALIMLENVPRMRTRGADLLEQMMAVLRAAGYEVDLRPHDCGEWGGLAQKRERLLLIARHREQAPSHLLQPPNLGLRPMSSVLWQLPPPLPPDGEELPGGPHHKLPTLSELNWLRLAAIPAGQDWRAIPERIERLMGDVNNLVIPFAGSLGELLGRSKPAPVETVNDLDGFVVNAWRGLTYAPDKLAELCDHPVHEVTMHAAHDLLLERAGELLEIVRSDPKAFDAELAAWWVWGASCWLGSGWCKEPSAKKPRLGGQSTRYHKGLGVARPWVSRPHLSHKGQGIVRQVPMLSGSYTGHPAHGQGVHNGTNREALTEYFSALALRLRWIRITQGDWKRVCTPAVTTSHGLTGLSLDPPYEHEGRSTRLYREDAPEISADVRAMAIERGADPLLRITLAGRGEEHDETLVHGWTKHVWRERDNETIWASPHCVDLDALPGQVSMFG